MLNSIFETIPSFTILYFELGSILIIPSGRTKAKVVFHEMVLKDAPTSQQLANLRERLRIRSVERADCEVCDGKLKIEVCLRLPRFFARRRLMSKSDRLMQSVVDWAKPMSETMSDDILGEFRWNDLHFVGRLTSGASKIKTEYWVDLFVAPGGQPQETLSNIARLRRLVQGWGEWELRIKEAILHSIYPEYHKCCDIRQDSIRHDEIGFWSELEVVSLLSESDGSVVVRYHSGDMFGSYRVEAVILDDQITCRVAY